MRERETLRLQNNVNKKVMLMRVAYSLQFGPFFVVVVVESVFRKYFPLFFVHFADCRNSTVPESVRCVQARPIYIHTVQIK